MKKQILLIQLLIYFFCCDVFSQEFEFQTNEKRSKKGKEIYEQFEEKSMYKNSKCWQLALEKIDESCRKMSDMHLSLIHI